MSKNLQNFFLSFLSKTCPVDKPQGFEPFLTTPAVGLLLVAAYRFLLYLVESIGVEPMTSCLQSRRSSQLS